MRSSRQPRHGAGYIASIALIFLLMISLVLVTSWGQRRGEEARLLQQQLDARLARELPLEVGRVVAQARAMGSVPDPRWVEAQAFVNLHTRGRREMVELERQRQHMKRLMANRVEVRARLSRLSHEVRRAQMWVSMLERRLETMPNVRPDPKRTGAAAPADDRHGRRRPASRRRLPTPRASGSLAPG